jgi:hypothetical protein
MQKYPEVLCYILDCLSNIWTQSEWKANLINAFGDCRFRTSVLNVFVFFEKELELYLKGNSSEIDQESSISYATLTNLLRLILPTLLTVRDYLHISLLVSCGCVNYFLRKHNDIAFLFIAKKLLQSHTSKEGELQFGCVNSSFMFQLLQYMQALWTKAAASNIPDVLEGAKSMVFSEGPGETLKVQNIDKEEQEQNAIRNWLETTRQIGYVCDPAIFLWITGYRM